MDYTGERYDPAAANALAFYDHYARYHFVCASFGTRNGRLLDFGCGLGVGTRFMARAFLSAVGVDPSVDAITRAKQIEARSSVAFYTSSEFSARGDDRFDVATCLEVIEHTHEQLALVDFVHSKVRKGGVAIFSTPNVLHTRSQGIHNPFHVRELSRAEFQDILEESFPYVMILDVMQVNGMAIVATASERDPAAHHVYASPGDSVETEAGLLCVANFVAVCSEEPFQTPKSLLLLDPQSTYVRQLEAIVKSQAQLVDERDALLASQDHLIIDRDRAIRAQVALINDRDRALTSQTKMIDERDALIREQADAISSLEKKLRRLRNPIAALRWLFRV